VSTGGARSVQVLEPARQVGHDVAAATGQQGVGAEDARWRRPRLAL
jgi:hypothetical protein